MAEEKAGADERTDSHIYFAVPHSTDTTSNEFSGQYLRLENYVGSDEDAHLPSGVSTSGLDGITVSSTGYFLLKADSNLKETFGNTLTEKISGAGHTITIDKGDWELDADSGKVSITASGTDANAKITFESTDSDITIHSVWGKASTSDSRDIKTSSSDTTTFISLVEYSGLAGIYTKTRSAFALSVNLVGDVVVKGSDIKFVHFPIKVILASSASVTIGSMKLLGFGFKMAINVRKDMLVYNKINAGQWYIEMCKSKNDIVKSQMAAAVDKEDYAAKMRRQFIGAEVAQMLKM